MADFSVYPDAIDGYAQLPLTIDNVTRVDAVTVNRLRSAIVNIENELGVLPSGTYNTVIERLDALEQDITQIESELSLIQSGISAEIEIKTLGYEDLLDVYIALDGTTSSTITLSPAPNNFILKNIYLRMVPNIGSGLFDPCILIFIEDIQVDGVSIINGVIPSTPLNPRYRTKTPTFNRLINSGEVITIKTVTTPTVNAGGVFAHPLATYVDGTSDLDLIKQSYLGLDSTIHTGPPVGGQTFTGSGGGQSMASTILTVNTAPLAAGDEIIFNKIAAQSAILTGVSGARTPGANDFDATIGTVSGSATEIAAAINDATNDDIEETFIATANAPSAGDIIIEHVGGEIGNLATLDVSTTPVGGITPTSASFSGGIAEVTELTFEAAPSAMTLNKLYTTIISEQGSGSADTFLEIGSVTINNGPNLITGRIGTSYTANGPGSLQDLGSGLVASPEFGISINSGDIVRITLVNNTGISGGVIAGWVVTLD